MKILTILFVSVLSLPSVSWAEYFEKDQLFIYKIQPYTEVLTNEEIVEFTAKLSQAALVSVLESMVEHKVFPENIASIEDVDKLRKANNEVETLVLYLNKLIEEQRKQKGRFSLPDMLPDAFMVFGGKKLSINIGGGVGGAVSLGVIFMPVFIEKYDQRSGVLVDEYFSVKMGVVGWGNGDIGVALGGGSRFAVGLGAIWDLNDAFVNPDQFWGAGMGASWSPLVLGAGVNAKVGFLSNWDMPGWVDFAYITAGLEVGASIEVSSPRLNFTTFLSGERIMTLLESSQKKAYEAALRELSRKMDLVFVELNKQKEVLLNQNIDPKDKNKDSEELKKP
ncbi:MAG: hypothetical protein KDD58_04230 [Bdellovibrionales bacterium]|nr:hypothetical protein [Bdellovibrionales bacterium]